MGKGQTDRCVFVIFAFDDHHVPIIAQFSHILPTRFSFATVHGEFAYPTLMCDHVLHLCSHKNMRYRYLQV